MSKTILMTGATDGIGLEAAKILASEGHHLLLHGRNPAKLDAVAEDIRAAPGAGRIDTYVADLARFAAVNELAQAIKEQHARLDVLINNAGVFKTSNPLTEDGLDVRFVVNTLAPYALTQSLLAVMESGGRVINLSSAAQAPVDLKALAGQKQLSDNQAYAQSKLALTMWSRSMAQSLGDGGPAIVAVNPGSLLATKMVKDAYGIAGSDVSQGSGILRRAALSDEFAAASGRYFDNDSGQFAPPHPDALDQSACEKVVEAVEAVLAKFA